MTDHRLLTVRQPWAKPIVDGKKTVENRSTGFTLKYRGPLWIHAGADWSDRGLASELVHQAYPEVMAGSSFRDEGFVLGAVIGLVDVVDTHYSTSPGCSCETPWAETEYRNADGVLVREVIHLVLANPRRCRGPVVAGALGLWRADRRPGLTETLDHLELEEVDPC